MKDFKHYGIYALGILAAIWGIIPLFLSFLWLVLHVLLGGFGGAQQQFYLVTHNLGSPSSGAFWMWVLLCSLGTLITFISFAVVTSDMAQVRRTFSWLIAFAVVLTLAGSYQAWHLSWQNSKNVARFYDKAAVVYTPSITNAPGSLQYLLAGAKKAQNGCWVSAADVPNCTKVGTLPAAGFDARVASAAGALIVMQRTSGTRQNVDLLASSMTYLNGNGKNGVWSALRDGIGAFQPTEGVVEWNGVTLPTECKFGGRDQFDKALAGVKSNSLVNYLTRLHPDLYWNSADVWGYCNAAKRPVMVIPLERQTHYLSQTVSVPAGVFVLTGSPSGKPQVSYRTHASNLPGPVYPKSMADTQLTSMNWMAGRAHLDRGQFGFEPTTSSAQAGNTTDYLLKSKTDGHEYWVTPLTLASNQSQLFVAYAMVRADTVAAGHLNTFKVYTLATNDPRQTNVDQLEAVAKSFMVTNAGGFIPSGGTLIEFTPAGGDYWRAFGEINGRVIYRLDISANSTESPILVSLDPTSGAPTGVVSGGGTSTGTGTGTGTNTKTSGRLGYCGEPIASLNNAQKLNCLRYFAGNVN